MKLGKVLTIAGSDSGGGAGIQADIKTMTSLKCYAASVITCITAQNTVGVQNIVSLEQNIIKQQLLSVLSDINFNAIKIGLLPENETITTLIPFLKKYKIWTVIDPVFIATSGDQLTTQSTAELLTKELLPHCQLITPNIPEAEVLSGLKITNTVDMEAAAIFIAQKFNIDVLLKGGHISGPICTDLLYIFKTKQIHRFENKKVDTKNTHGTGCTLSSAIASLIAKEYKILKAVDESIKYVHQSIKSGQNLNIGSGNGPINHLIH